MLTIIEKLKKMIFKKDNTLKEAQIIKRLINLTLKLKTCFYKKIP